ncbi:OFA family MFS transporter [Streptomyces sp. NPDC026672]|uniref:OFA family MFS transporter n=1 Tax=unclassified Streptomyces TaxID=2593676 RepID=UPI0033C50CD6
MTNASPIRTAHREVTDANGRVYRIGESPRDILGGPRLLMVVLPWVAMMAISVAEYAYGSAEETLSSVHGWSSTNTFWLLGVWTVFQAAVAFPVGRLRERGLLTARQAMLIGAALAGAGFFALSHAPDITLAVLGFGVLGGSGAGMVYATCINIVGKWYPERRGGKTGFVNSGFAYGSVPMIFVFTYAFDAHNFRTVLDLVGTYVLVFVAVVGWFFKDPPKNWWPADIDPLATKRDTKRDAALTKNPPAVRQYGPMEAVRTGMLPLMWFCLTLTSGVSIFGISFQVPFAKEAGFGPLVVASSMGVMAVVNGTGRGVMGWVSDVLGRKQALVLVVAVEGLSQFGVLWAGDLHNEALFMIFAFVSGFGGGSFYPLFASLVPDYFGENNNAQNYGLVYSSKLVGGLAGSGLGATVVAAWGYSGAYALAGCFGLVSAALAMLLRQPGRTEAREVRPAELQVTGVTKVTGEKV